MTCKLKYLDVSLIAVFMHKKVAQKPTHVLCHKDVSYQKELTQTKKLMMSYRVACS